MNIGIVETYIVVLGAFITAIKGILEIIKMIREIKEKTPSNRKDAIPVSLGRKLNVLIVAIGLVVMLGGVGWLAYNNQKVDSIKQGYFRDKDPQLQNNDNFLQKFEQYYQTNYVQPAYSVIGAGLVLLALTFFVGSFSKHPPSIIEFVLEIFSFLIGIWLLFGNR